ncbi:unnamed protein product, partial [Closterium sp. NIES-54]
MTPRADLLTELEPSPVKHVTSALGQRAKVKGIGKAMFKGADGKMVGLKNVLWVPNLAANLISVRRLQKAGMDMSSKGAKTYTARLGERILWDLHADRDVYNEMWQIPVVPTPKERQVAASISTKGEAVGSGDGANGRTKEIESKNCDLGGTSKLGEHEESGAAAKEQNKGEEYPKAVAEEEYRESMWGTISSAAFSNPTLATGECDWLTLHRRMGHVALPILQQLFTRYPFSSSEATAKAPLDEVVMDVVGPLKLGAAGAEYFLTIVDVYTRMTWVYVLSKKSDVAETVKTDWLPMVERQQDRLVKAICTDRGGEFMSKEFSLWLKKNGIRHSLTMPYSLAMNGIAERANRTITETARGLLIEAGLPDYFWPDAVRSACVAKNRVLTHVGADKWVPYVEWIGRKPKVDMLWVFGCMCMALVPTHLRHNKLGAKAIWAVHLGMAQNIKGWLLWDPFTRKFLVSRDCKFMENLMYKDWKAENEAKIGMRFGDVKSSGLEHVELPLELSSGSTTTRQSSLVNGGEEAKDAEEEEEEVQQVSERAPTLSSRTTSAPRIQVTPHQRLGLHVPAAEEEGRGKRRIQAPNRLTYDALGKPAKSALAGAALIVGDDEESDYDECAFAFFSPMEMPGEPATLKKALESSDAKEWKKAMESELKSNEENDTWELVELPKGRKAITSKWLFKIKSDADGKIERYKSRLVAKGYQQKEKVDYKELFAPVVKPTTLRTLLAGAAIKGWVVKQMDVATAFLNGVLEEEIFMVQPEGTLAQHFSPPQPAAVDFGATVGGDTGGAESGGAATGGAETGGAASPSGGGAVGDPARGHPGGGGYGPAGTGGTAGAGGAGAATTGGAAGAASAGGTGGTAGAGGSGAASPGGPTGGATGAGSPTGAAGAGAGGTGGATGAGGAGAASLGGAAGALGHLLGLPPAPTEFPVAGSTPPLLFPPTDKSEPQLLPHSPLPAPPPYTEVTESLTERREPKTRASTPERRETETEASRVVLPSPPASSLPDVADPPSDLARASSPIVSRFLATIVTDPLVSSPVVSALVAELVDFAAANRLDYLASLVSEPDRACPPSVGGEVALGCDVLKERKEELECLAATVPHLATMLLTPEGDPAALDIPTPRSYSEAILGEYSSQWQTAMDAEMASWKSTSTYVDEVPPPGANIVDGMWIFMVKRPPGSPPVFKARYVARGFIRREGVNFFHTFSPTPKMTTLWVLLHVAAQHDYELHYLDFSTAFLQRSLHEAIWLRRPPGFTGLFPEGSQWSLWRPVCGLHRARREWHNTLRTTLAALGFAPSTSDPSLFLRTDTTLPPFYALVNVNDLVFATADTEALALVKVELQERHTCTNLGELRNYLGLQITRDRTRRTITLTHSHMVHQVLQRFGFQFSLPRPTPLSTGHLLSSPPSDESVVLQCENE